MTHTGEPTHLTRPLSREHRALLGRLSELERSLCGRDLQRVHRLLSLLRNDLFPHRIKEEEGLFPRLARHLLPDCGPVECMLQDHEDERVFVLALEAAVKSKEMGRVRAAGEALVTHLRQHILKEEEVIYPMAERLLSEEDKAEVRRVFERVAFCSEAFSELREPAGDR